MLRKLKVCLLKEGMKVAKAIYNSDGQVLLIKGVILNDKYIDRLKKLGIPAVYIDDGITDVEIYDVIADETRTKALKNIKNMFELKSKSNLAKNMLVSKEVLDSVSDILDELLNKSDIVINLTDIRVYDDYTFAHSVNVCVLALVTGIALGYNQKKLYNLGLGAILHDIGKVMVPKEILNKPNRLMKEEFEVIKKHPSWGYDLLKDKSEINCIVRTIVYQHHERWDGSGYPNRLKGNQIDELAQVVGLVDMYDAVTADRVYRKAMPAYEAFEMIAASGGFLFRFDIVKAFLNHIAAYPVGTWVKLSNGCIALVLETRHGMALCPKVKILFDASNNIIEEYLDLRDVINITIVKVLKESEIERLSIRLKSKQL